MACLTLMATCYIIRAIYDANFESFFRTIFESWQLAVVFAIYDAVSVTIF
jgi:hypothetical protein